MDCVGNPYSNRMHRDVLSDLSLYKSQPSAVDLGELKALNVWNMADISTKKKLRNLPHQFISFARIFGSM